MGASSSSSSQFREGSSDYLWSGPIAPVLLGQNFGDQGDVRYRSAFQRLRVFKRVEQFGWRKAGCGCYADRDPQRMARSALALVIDTNKDVPAIAVRALPVLINSYLPFP